VEVAWTATGFATRVVEGAVGIAPLEDGVVRAVVNGMSVGLLSSRRKRNMRRMATTSLKMSYLHARVDVSMIFPYFF
jgi:hypothetical protein